MELTFPQCLVTNLIHIRKEAARRGTPQGDEKIWVQSLIARFMGPTWGSSGANRIQVGPMLAPWTLLSGVAQWESLRRNYQNLICISNDKILGSTEFMVKTNSTVFTDDNFICCCIDNHQNRPSALINVMIEPQLYNGLELSDNGVQLPHNGNPAALFISLCNNTLKTLYNLMIGYLQMLYACI